MAELAATAAATGAVGTTGRTAAPPADEPQGGMTQAAPDAEASRLSFRQWLLNGGPSQVPCHAPLSSLAFSPRQGYRWLARELHVLSAWVPAWPRA